MGLKNIMLCERIQAEKAQYYIIPLICAVWQKGELKEIKNIVVAVRCWKVKEGEKEGEE